MTIRPAVTTSQKGSRVAAVTLAAALVPIVLTVTRAIVSGRVPIFDAGYFTVRSRDVLTEHHPWLGAWSSASMTLGETIRNLGPLQLDLLAPFTKLDPYWGTAVGVGGVAAASVVAVWWSAQRVLGPVGAGGAMLATVALQAAIGSATFIDPRQQMYLLLPYWALLWLTWATAMGNGVALGPLVFTASLIMQTHFTYLFQTLLLVLGGAICYVAAVRGRWREAKGTRHLLVGLAVGVGCWAQTVWDQLFGERNLGAVLAERGGDEGVGWGEGARVIAGTVLLPLRFWLPDSLGSFDLPADLASPGVAWVAVLLWLALVLGAAWVAWRRGNEAFAKLGLIAGIALVGAIVAGSQIPPTVFGWTPQSYFWMWPTGAFLTAAVVGGLLAGVANARRALIATPGQIGLVASCLTVALVAARPADPFVEVASARTAGERVARPVVDELASGLRRHDVTGPVVVDYSRSTFGTYVGYVLLAELQRAGVEFTFDAEDLNLNRFGRQRCEQGDAVNRIVLADAGGDPVARDGETVLAHVDAFTDADRAELIDLDRRFGDWLRDGSVEFDLGGLEYFAGGPLPGLDAVLTTPGQPATGLARTLAPWQAWGLIHMPRDLRAAFERWIDLHTRSVLEDVTILLAPIPRDDDESGWPVRAASCVD